MEITPRDEVRASSFGQLRCPSCGELAGELLGHHNLILMTANVRQEPGIWMGIEVKLLKKDRPWAECRDGQRVELDGWEMWEAAANISCADQMWFSDSQLWARSGFPVWNWQENQ